MVIITIKFKRDSDKTYDYLMKNPDKNVLDQNQCIYFATGCNKYGPRYSTAFIVGARKTNVLPEHVTAWLIIYKNNHVASRTISAAEKSSLLAQHREETRVAEPQVERSAAREIETRFPGTVISDISRRPTEISILEKRLQYFEKENAVLRWHLQVKWYVVPEEYCVKEIAKNNIEIEHLKQKINNLKGGH